MKIYWHYFEDNYLQETFHSKVLVNMMTTRKLFTLALVRNGGNVLLGMKKRGFGKGKWNGFGGKVEPGETIYEAAVRELEEESGLIAHTLDTVGVLEFEFVGDPILLEVHVFTTNKYSGELTNTEEMDPHWFDVDKIPFDKMWSDDRFWFPLFLQGQKFKGYFLYKDEESILKHDLRVVDNVLK